MTKLFILSLNIRILKVSNKILFNEFRVENKNNILHPRSQNLLIYIHFLKVIPGVGVAPLPIIEPGVGEVFPPAPVPILDASITPPLKTLLGGVTGLFAPD